jgi:predicted AAA+ superfamily ATPase
VRRLPAFHANLRKRLVKSPKIHWRDTGLLHAMLGIRDERSLLSHPVAGPSWESYVVEQAIGLLLARCVRHEAFHFRSGDGYEIDLVLEAGSERWAIEIKLTSNPSPADFARLDRCAEMISATRRVLVSRTPSDAGDRRRLSCGLDRFLQELSKLKG